MPQDATVTYIGNGQIHVGVYAVAATVNLSSNETRTYTGTLTIASVTTHKVIFKQAGQPDKVIEVEQNDGMDKRYFPTIVQVPDYTLAWKDVDLSHVTSDITVNAIATPITYTITYELDGRYKCE